MKKLSVFETSILGLFIGVIISTYLTFIINNDGLVGNIISWVSLRPILNLIPATENSTLFISFAFFVLVYFIYGLIIGAIIHYINKPKILIIPLIILLLGISFEEFNNYSKPVARDSKPESYLVSNVVTAVPKKPKQYFGNEATGDLNGDNKDDIAFLIHRDDEDRGTLYYLTAALSTSTGHIGTNLIFLGEKIYPQNISIENGLIDITYTTKTSTTTEKQFAHLKGNNLEKTTKITTQATSTNSI
jgi:hypothetical protein